MFPLLFFIAFAGGLSQVAERRPASTIRTATPRSSSCSCCSSRPRSAASSPGSASPATSRVASRAGCCSPRRTGSGSWSATAWRRSCAGAITATLLTIIALVAGMQVGGGPVDVVGLYTLAADHEPLRLPLGGRDRDAAAHDPGRAADADAGVPAPLHRTGLRAARAARRRRCTRSPGSTRSPTRSRPGAASWRAIRRMSALGFGLAARGRDRLLGVGVSRAALGRGRRVAAPGLAPLGSARCDPGPESRSRSALRGTGTARTSRSPRRTPSASSCACSTTTTSRPASSSRATRRTTGTGTCPASARASATATGSTGPGRPRRGTASTRSKLLIDPYAKAIEGPVLWDRGRTLAYAGDDDLVHRRDRRRRGDPEVGRDRRLVRLGGRPAAPAAVGRDRDLRAAREGLHAADARGARGPARHLRRARLRRRDRAPRRPRA